MMKDLLEIQPMEQESGLRERQAPSRRQAPAKTMLRRLVRIGGGILPYLAWLVPLMDRLVPRRETAMVPAGLRTLSTDLRSDLREELRTHLVALQANQQPDLSPAIESQQKRLEKLEEQAAELNHSLTNLSEDQLDLADQVRAMAGWVRNCAIAALILLALLFALKLVQTIHIVGH